MPNDPENRLTLRQANQTRTDFAAIEFLMEQIAQLRAELLRICPIGTTALGLAFVLH